MFKLKIQHTYLILLFIVVLISIIFLTNKMISSYFDDANTEICGEAEKLIELINNGQPDNENTINELNKKWSKSAEILPLFFDHADIEKIDLTLERINAYYELNDFSAMELELKQFIKQVQNAHDRDELSISNIF